MTDMGRTIETRAENERKAALRKQRQAVWDHLSQERGHKAVRRFGKGAE